MQRTSYRSYLLFIAFFFCVISLPKSQTNKWRSCVIASISPCWQGLHTLKESTLFLLSLPLKQKENLADEKDMQIEILSQENHLLRLQLENVSKWILFDQRLQKEIDRFYSLDSTKTKDPTKEEFFKRRAHALCQSLIEKSYAMPAQVIFREPASWSSTFWINLGEADNQRLNQKVIGLYSPVILGSSIVGVVESVSQHQSKVRLITDRHVAPSVRAVRGEEQTRTLLESIDPLLIALEHQENNPISSDDIPHLKDELAKLKQQLLGTTGNLYLAKGELHGTSRPLWRARSSTLKGIGFNYDFADLEGPARDLRSGAPYGTTHPYTPIPLLQEGDLLITTGFDGIFPPGFHVAIISSISTLKEGATSYEIEAVATAGDLNTLTHVFVLPPVERD